MSHEEVLTFEDAERLEEEIVDQGGSFDEQTPCKNCGNLTLATVPYKPFRAKKVRYVTVCMFCDFMVRWPRMEML